MPDTLDKGNPPEKRHENIFSLKQGDESIDTVLKGHLKVIQKVKGYRFSIDAYLLSRLVHLNQNDHVLDMGTGSAVIAMILASRWARVKIIGLDVQEELVDMARRSVAMNNLENKIDIRQGDIRTIETLFDRGSFDAVVINPPYRKLKSGRVNPAYQKSVARHEIKGSLGDFLKAARYVLKASGRVFIIYPATRVVELICQMRNMSIEPKRLQVVYSHDRSHGEFVLLEGIKGGKEEIQISPPLFIYAGNGSYTEEMACLFRELSVSP
jgi:tRNA1Val (adenine37-N6)-methyltransferase